VTTLAEPRRRGEALAPSVLARGHYVATLDQGAEGAFREWLAERRGVVQARRSPSGSRVRYALDVRRGVTLPAELLATFEARERPSAARALGFGGAALAVFLVARRLV
jgi:hypothetical protein